jgi:ammonia channel protein AmtB
VAAILPRAGVILEHSALATGFLAAAIAVGGFLARARALLGSDSEVDLQRETTVGGLQGFLFGVVLILIDVVVS